ncbi:MAG: response regulator transcription factor [Leptospiraceae bacterium]|nr:response regulator transcription factor [Leptospiraceae bacterium]MCP5495747.1 response regulator transcription factor [Leptospiraceae bacterium]
MKQPIVYIIDDHEIFLVGLRATIENSGLNVVVRTFVIPEELYRSMQEEEPDIIIADLILSISTGLEVILRARALLKNVKAILISSTKEDRIKEMCQKSEIQGYIYKSESEKDILSAIQTVLEGGEYYSEESGTEDIEVVKSYDKINPFSKLTKRELEVVVYLSKGMSYSEIAKQMNISSKTVNTHRVNITEKLGKMSLQHLIMKANIWGIVKSHNLYTNFKEKDI